VGKVFFHKQKRPSPNSFPLPTFFYPLFLCLLCLEDNKTSRPKQSKARITGTFRLGGKQKLPMWSMAYIFSFFLSPMLSLSDRHTKKCAVTHSMAFKWMSLNKSGHCFLHFHSTWFTILQFYKTCEAFWTDFTSTHPPTHAHTRTHTAQHNHNQLAFLSTA
jgi:hypothetical protein